MEIGDIIQITNETHPWYPCLLIVDEVKMWGVQAYCIVPQSNDGSEPVGRAYNRIKNEDFVKVGKAEVYAE